MPSQRVVFCYAQEDANAVLDIYDRLQAAGFAPWASDRDILPGQQWDRETKAAIRSASVILIFLSARSAQRRGYLQREIRLALDSAMEFVDGHIAIIPIRLEEFEMPDSLGHLYSCDLFKEDGFDRLQKALAAGIQASDNEQDIAETIETGSAELRSRVFSEPTIRQDVSVKNGNAYVAGGNVIINNGSGSSGKKNWWERWDTRVGLAVATITLVGLLLGLPEKIQDFMKYINPPTVTEKFIGVVTDQMNQPIRGAVVKLQQLPGDSLVTTSDGSFIFRGVPGQAGDEVRIYVSAIGYESWDEYTALPGPISIRLSRSQQ